MATGRSSTTFTDPKEKKNGMVGVIQRGNEPVGASGSHLGALFCGGVCSDHLPTSPHRQGPQAYVVNTDPHRRPGQHWLALWTPGDDTCEIMDSFGLPLERYGSRPLEAWLARHWKVADTNRTSLQALTSWTCGHYVLMYLMLKSRGETLTQFLNRFSRHDYVQNDHRVSQWLKWQIQSLKKKK